MPFYEPEQKPCPICDAPNCAPHDEAGPRKILFEEWAKEETVSDEQSGKSVVVPHDVVQDVSGPNDKRPRIKRLAKAGSRVTPERARELGIIASESAPPPALETK